MTLLVHGQQSVLLREPEHFQLSSGELSSVAPLLQPQQPYRCMGCTRTECQVLATLCRAAFAAHTCIMGLAA